VSKPLPRAIQRQLDEAEAIQAQIAAAQQPVTLETPAEPPVEAQEPAPQPVPAQPVEDDAAVWKQRYKTLQGEFNAKVPKLQHQVKDLESRLEQAIARLDSVKSEPQKLVTEKDAEEFGADMLDLIDRKVREAQAPLLDHIDRLNNELSQAKAAVGEISQVQLDTESQRFYAKLGELVPNFEQVNQDPEWLHWLTLEDPVSGIVRQTLLDDAAKVLRADRVANIFQSYLREAQPAQPVQPVADTLARQVAPTRTAPAPAPVAQPQGRIYTGAEVAAVFDPRSRRKYTPEQYEALVNDVNLAISQGRVVP